MSTEGSLTIQLRETRGGFEVAIASSRPIGLTRLFVGQSPAQVVRQIPLLFSVCGTAQTAAAIAAFEQAQPGCLRQPGAHGPTPSSLVWIETAREHLWRILLDWSGFLGIEPPLEATRGTGKLLTEARAIPRENSNDHGLAIVAAVGDRLDTLLEDWIFEEAPAHWLTRSEPAALDQWLRESRSLAAATLRRIESLGWAQLGATPTCPLGQPDLAELNRRLSGDSRDFCAAPLWENAPRETSAYTREFANPLVRCAASRWDQGLATRLFARLAELAGLSSLALTPTGHGVTGLSPASKVGIACLEASRGLLVHRVELDERDRVSAYTILAPTEWNFHPRGIAAQALGSLPHAAPDTIQQQAALLIGAIDPCVSFTIRVGPE